jgi:NAD(P)H dehydrogenase (quinone)
MIIVGSPYSIEELNKTQAGGTPYGPSHVESYNSSSTLTPDEYKVAFRTGTRMAQIIEKLNA